MTSDAVRTSFAVRHPLRCFLGFCFSFLSAALNGPGRPLFHRYSPST